MQLNKQKLDQFIYYVNEREAIQLRRERGDAPPWTKDVILRHYHFCCNRREDDRGTREIRRVCHELGVEPRYLPSFYTAARMFNKASTAKAYWKGGVDLIKGMRNEGMTLFHVAYVVSTCGAAMDKIDYVDGVVTSVSGLVISNASCERAFKDLRMARGLGSFLAGQVVADLKNDRYLANAPDWHTFAVMGPGSKKGLDLLFGPGTTELNFPRRLEALQKEVQGLIPELHAQDLQNCLCEASKYWRHLDKLGGRKRVYTPQK